MREMIGGSLKGRLLRSFSAKDEHDNGQRLVLPLILCVSTLAALALLLVWLNIERTKLAYRVRTLQHELSESMDLNAKLGVEREHLLSPHILGKKAEVMGLGPARPGQIRRMNPDSVVRAGHE